MSEMIERVAKAIHASGYVDAAKAEAVWEQILPDSTKDSWRMDGRAAIEAMREPTEAMVSESEIGWREELGRLYCRNIAAKQAAARSMFRAMIAAALK